MAEGHVESTNPRHGYSVDPDISEHRAAVPRAETDAATQVQCGPGAGLLPSAAGRAVDMLLASVALVLLAVPMLLVAVLVRLDSPGPALFKQRRIGAQWRPFTFYKYRTMHVNTDDRAHRELIARDLRGNDTMVNGSRKLSNDPRVTRVGALLRCTSFDELPQLINVLLGHMSLVGPRPCLPWESDLFPREFHLRFAVRPGITGLWQISGRSRLGTMDMLRLDVRYVHSRGFCNDLMILVKTIPSLLRGSGAR